jgi:phage baseplate assembly protein V
MNPLKVLGNHIKMMIARAVISAVNDSGQAQMVSVQLLDNESRSEIERVQQFGFTSRPHPDAVGVVIFQNGNRSLGWMVGENDRRYRPRDLQPGDCVMYSDQDQPDGAHRIELTRNRLTLLRGAIRQSNFENMFDISSETHTITAAQNINQFAGGNVGISANNAVNIEGTSTTVRGFSVFIESRLGGTLTIRNAAQSILFQILSTVARVTGAFQVIGTSTFDGNVTINGNIVVNGTVTSTGNMNTTGGNMQRNGVNYNHP